MKLEFYFPILIGCTYQESSDTLSEEVNVIENTQSDIYNKYADTLINISYNNKDFITLKMLIDEHKENVEEFFKSINQRFKGNKLENDVEISEKGLILIRRYYFCIHVETRSNYRYFFILI
ncbi:hypothetical protein A0H76_172 [Hepatospora eriocheir]|uniref:Uncharacterized protein n=1 Tax=Hepatospora eriocheir TaxID=1081669 RepID=A0A1X0QJ51_9MICR|nr:hypothetical protein A0H76_172 [Hepatospora eriocheir]